jgi:hypothetical protein
MQKQEGAQTEELQLTDPASTSINITYALQPPVVMQQNGLGLPAGPCLHATWAA